MYHLHRENILLYHFKVWFAVMYLDHRGKSIPQSRIQYVISKQKNTRLPDDMRHKREEASR